MKKRIYNEKIKSVSLSDFLILKQLGKGAYGEVYLVKRKASQEYYALKVIQFPENINKKFWINLQNEIKVLSVIDGRFLVKAYFSFVELNNLCIIMEFMLGGDMRDVLEKYGILDNDVSRHYIA